MAIHYKEFNSAVKEYLEIKRQLIEQFNYIKEYIYEYEVNAIGIFDGQYELCKCELEIYDFLKFVYEDKDECDTEYFSCEAYLKWASEKERFYERFII